jgi:hydroxylaminobenzene mutase
MNIKTRRAQTLLGLGALLFFLGLVSGVAIPGMTNQRMGLSGHLEGVMNGTFLLVIGVAWPRFSLAPLYETTAYWALIYGTFANWLFVTLAAVFGTSAMTPIAGAGHQGLAWQETLVTIGLLSVGVTMLLACGLLVWGFFRGVKEMDTGVA